MALSKPAAVVLPKNPTEEFIANLLAAPRMWSVRWYAVIGGAISWFLSVNDPAALISTIQSWPIHPIFIGLLVTIVGVLFRVWPQFNLFAKLLNPGQQEVVAAGAPMAPAGTPELPAPPPVVEQFVNQQEAVLSKERAMLHVLAPNLTEAGVEKVVAALALVRSQE